MSLHALNQFIHFFSNLYPVMKFASNSSTKSVNFIDTTVKIYFSSSPPQSNTKPPTPVVVYSIHSPIHFPARRLYLILNSSDYAGCDRIIQISAIQPMIYLTSSMLAIVLNLFSRNLSDRYHPRPSNRLVPPNPTPTTPAKSNLFSTSTPMTLLFPKSCLAT